MSPESFSREYWPSLDQNFHFGLMLASKSSRISLSVKVSLPTILMWRDFGHVAFVDDDGDADAVAVQLGDARVDTDRVTALAEILLDQFLLEAVQHQPVEHFAFGQTDVEQHAAQFFVLDGFVAREGNVGNGRPFPDGDDQDIALPVQADILEEAGAVKLPDRRTGIGRGQRIAGVQGQVIVYGALGNALQAFNANIRYGE